MKFFEYLVLFIYLKFLKKISDRHWLYQRENYNSKMENNNVIFYIVKFYIYLYFCRFYLFSAKKFYNITFEDKNLSCKNSMEAGFVQLHFTGTAYTGYSICQKFVSDLIFYIIYQWNKVR